MLSNRNIALILLIFGGFVIWNDTNSEYSLCFFKNIFHIPCAGCGLTRAFNSILSGNFNAAFYYNALSIPLFVFFVFAGIWIIVDYFKKDESFNRFMHHRLSSKYIIVIVIITLGNWIWNIKKGI